MVAADPYYYWMVQYYCGNAHTFVTLRNNWDKPELHPTREAAQARADYLKLNSVILQAIPKDQVKEDM